MSKRVVHMYEWDGGTEADQDPPEDVLCGTEGNMSDDQLTSHWRYVTCKRCLKVREKQLAWRAAEEREQKVKLFDEAQAITNELGYRNISTAIKALREECTHQKAEIRRLQETAGDAERLAALLRVQLTELKSVARAVLEARDEDDEPIGHPGHCHAVRGVWDSTGKPCSDCRAYEQLDSLTAEDVPPLAVQAQISGRALP